MKVHKLSRLKFWVRKITISCTSTGAMYLNMMTISRMCRSFTSISLTILQCWSNYSTKPLNLKRPSSVSYKRTSITQLISYSGKSFPIRSSIFCSATSPRGQMRWSRGISSTDTNFPSWDWYRWKKTWRNCASMWRLRTQRWSSTYAGRFKRDKATFSMSPMSRKRAALSQIYLAPLENREDQVARAQERLRIREGHRCSHLPCSEEIVLRILTDSILEI